MEDEIMQKANAHLDATKPAHQRYEQEIARIEAIYDQAVAPALEKYNEIKASAYEVYTQAKTHTANDEEVKVAFEQYDQIVKTAWKDFQRETVGAQSERIRARAQARETVEREIASIDQLFFGIDER